jgi:predicted glycoside hydrolase/deacetylase ChbG (UPF0249 family)
MSKYIVPTSDDFGMCHAVNAGIAQAMTEGVVRSSNLMVPCPWFDEALELTRAHSLPVGVHLVLTCDWDRLKWGPLTRAESLVDEHGHFPTSYTALGERAKEAEIYAELAAQIDRVKRRGVTPTHLDSHMLPSTAAYDIGPLVRSITRRLAREHGLIYTYDRDADGLVHFVDEIEISGLPLSAVIQRLETATAPGAYLLIGHAAQPSAELEALCSPTWHARDWAATYRVADREFFTSLKTVQLFERLGFEIISIADLVALAPHVRRGAALSE